MRCSIPRPFLALAALGLLAGAPAAHAQNLVSNPGFETGNFNSWLGFGATTQNFAAGTHGGIAPHGGAFQALFGAIGATGGIFQNVAIPISANYTFSFWLANLTGTPNSFEATFGGVPLLVLTNAPAFSYTQYSFNVLGAGSSVISFSAQHAPDRYLLDDVSLVATATQSTVPEPGTVLLLGSGLAGLGAVAARRRRRAVAAERGRTLTLRETLARTAGSTGTGADRSADGRLHLR